MCDNESAEDSKESVYPTSYKSAHREVGLGMFRIQGAFISHHGERVPVQSLASSLYST